jgi:gp32 DNA binding protein like
MSFATLKRNSANSFDKLTKEIEKIASSEGGADERFWKPELDKSGNGYAVIRFLPAPVGEDVPWAKIWSHAFQGPGGWYIENSLTTLNKKDPVGELNRQLWNSGSDRDKEVARKQKRKLSYYSNIYVVKDPTRPENEGKVFLYKYGKKIHDKIVEAMQPAFADEKPINPFDFWTGADFKLKIRKVDGYWNYDKSEFAEPAVLGGFDDDQLEAIYNKLNPLAEFMDAKNFKTYEELQTRLTAVLNSKPVARVDRETAEDEEEFQVEQTISRTVTTTSDDEDEDDALSYFARLAEED